jgi:uncharacterized protein
LKNPNHLNMKKQNGSVIYSPSDLVRYFASPFASWMDRCHLESPGQFEPDEETEDQRLIAETGNQHERNVLAELKVVVPGLLEVRSKNLAAAREETIAAFNSKVPIVFQAALEHEGFAGFADFVMLGADDKYQVWDTKLARSPKPYYAIQLCCYSEMLATTTGDPLPEKFGIILGSNERVEFRVEDFMHFYRKLKAGFLEMQNGFSSGKLSQRPEPLPRADHGRWSSHAETFFLEADHLVQVAGIGVGQMKKLGKAGIHTMAQLAESSGQAVPKLAGDTLEKLVSQARLQCLTREDRQTVPEAPPRYELLLQAEAEEADTRKGLAALPASDPADVFFDMEGYPLVAGGLEYLFGACYREGDSLAFIDWWAHDRAEEKLAFEGFIDWVYARWHSQPAMHIYHYAAYEVSAVRRLSSRHDTRQEEVDQLLRNRVFVDLYQIVRHGLRIGEDSYSIKKVEHLYRPGRKTEVATAVDSIVQYARWIECAQSADWKDSAILRSIRDYNEDDCVSTAELVDWLRGVAEENGVVTAGSRGIADVTLSPELSPEVLARQKTARQLREQKDAVAITLADLIEFHRREANPIWWRMFDRADATPEQLHDDSACIEGVIAQGSPRVEKKSLVQRYRFEPSQECKLAGGGKTQVMFTHNLEMRFNLLTIDLAAGELQLKATQKSLDGKCNGNFPKVGSLLPDEFVSPAGIPDALREVAWGYVGRKLHPPVEALLTRQPPASPMKTPAEFPLDAAIRIVDSMDGGCLVIQGPPGTGKTYTASHVIAHLLAQGKKVGVSSNSHKVVMNVFEACGEAMAEAGSSLQGIKVGGDPVSPIYAANPGLVFVGQPGDARDTYQGGVVGGTAWLFTRPEWVGELDFLFIDEAGQVPLANAVAMARCAENLILLGDQMQLEQPIQGSHPGDAGLSVLQYALMDPASSKADAPVFHAVVPPELGLFLGESRRMHPLVCQFISDSIYEGSLHSHSDCARQKISAPGRDGVLIDQEAGIVFSPVIHDGNVQQSDEEVQRVKSLFEELLGRPYTDKANVSRALELDDFLFIAPYNAQVRALQATLPAGARVGSVDRFQGQEAPVCIFSLCSSFGEYGSRGLGFILDRNRVNVAISRAKCLAVVVADPRIAHSPVHSIAEITLLNLFCKILESANSGS